MLDPDGTAKAEEVCARSRYPRGQNEVDSEGAADAQILGNCIGSGVTDWPSTINDRMADRVDTPLFK